MLPSLQGTAAVAHVILFPWSQTWSRWSLKKGLRNQLLVWYCSSLPELVSPEQGSFSPSNARILTPLNISLPQQTHHPTPSNHVGVPSSGPFRAEIWGSLYVRMDTYAQWVRSESRETWLAALVACDAWGSLAVRQMRKKTRSLRKTGFRGQGRNGKVLEKS